MKFLSNTEDDLRNREDQAVERVLEQVVESCTMVVGLLDVTLQRWVEVGRDG